MFANLTFSLRSSLTGLVQESVAEARLGAINLYHKQMKLANATLIGGDVQGAIKQVRVARKTADVFNLGSMMRVASCIEIDLLDGLVNRAKENLAKVAAVQAA